jgi:probable F420-dependent oxidoreductase
MSKRVRIGVQIAPGGAPDYSSWRRAVLDTDAMGVDAIFGYDHFHLPAIRLRDDAPPGSSVWAAVEVLPEQPDVNNFEGWTALASWAEITTHCEIGLLVTGIGYRNPDLLADMARTVDHISGGRLILGLGAGWYPKDYEVYGYDFGTVATRLQSFAEGLERIQHRLGHLTPPPVRNIPILIGGSGETKTLPLVGRYANIWHCFEDPQTFRRKDDLVKEHAEAAGRDASAIERAVRWPDPATADDFVACGVTLFTTEVNPTAAGYDPAPIEEMLRWRDSTNG